MRRPNRKIYPLGRQIKKKNEKIQRVANSLEGRKKCCNFSIADYIFDKVEGLSLYSTVLQREKEWGHQAGGRVIGNSVSMLVNNDRQTRAGKSRAKGRGEGGGVRTEAIAYIRVRYRQRVTIFVYQLHVANIGATNRETHTCTHTHARARCRNRCSRAHVHAGVRTRVYVIRHARFDDQPVCGRRKDRACVII